MIILKKNLSRRTVLRGLGTAVALPFLDSMVPALRASAATPVSRLGVVYVPNGIAMRQWTPSAVGDQFAMTPTLKTLAPFREQMLILSGLNSKPEVMASNLPVGFHSRASTRFLTDIQPKPTEGSALAAGVSMDQIAAQQLGEHTQLASLEMSLESPDEGGSGDPGFSKVYCDTIAWRSSTTPLPMENNPRAVFERLFGDSGNTDPKARLARLEEERSILDSVSDSVADLKRGLGPKDCSKLSEYLDAVRDVERRIQNSEQRSSDEVPKIARPAGIPADFAEHARLMYDLYLLAYQCDVTRVVTFMVGHEFSGQTYPQVGVPDAHHAISHHQNDPVRLAKLAKIDAYNVSLFAEFIQKMKSTPDGDGSLLDHSMIIYGAGMSDGNVHDPRNLPVVLVGGGCGKVKGGRHLQFAQDTPLANLHITLLHRLGIRMDRIGDSSGELRQLEL